MSDDGPRGKGTPDNDAFAPTMAPTGDIGTAKTMATPMEAEVSATVAADSQTAAAPTTGAKAINLPAAPLQNFQFVERYQVRTQLGAGGMGEVQLIRDEIVGRQVAMKTIHSHHSGSADTIARFLREARVQGQLEHPSIVPVYDMGVDADGSPYFTMKRLKGMTLQTILKKARAGDRDVTSEFTTHKLLTDFTQVCQAIDFAHRRGVVHRDLKPDNIMLGHFGEVYVLDWGIAKIAGVDDQEAGDASASMRIDTGEITTEQTAHGSILGTPGYMAPEQIRGDIEAIDARSDVYSLGAILFEILTLERLHRGSTGAELIASTKAGADAAASERAPARDVAPELEAICVKATATEATERYTNVHELYEAVEGYLAGDRDAERRKQLAVDHVRRASQAAERVFEQGDDAAETRQLAMTEATRAFALDPSNAQAGRIITQLMLQPPKRIPDEVERSTQEALQQRAFLHVRRAPLVYLACFSFLPLYIWMGITSWPLVIGIGVALTVSGGLAVLCATDARYLNRKTMAMAILSNGVFLVLASRAFGWMILLPGLAVSSTIAFLLHRHLQNAWYTIGVGCSAVLVPFALELLGVLSTSYRFVDGAMIVTSSMVQFHEVPVLVAFVLSAIALVVSPALLVINHTRDIADAERQVHLQAWQLRQVMPDQTS